MRCSSAEFSGVLNRTEPKCLLILDDRRYDWSNQSESSDRLQAKDMAILKASHHSNPPIILIMKGQTIDNFLMSAWLGTYQSAENLAAISRRGMTPNDESHCQA